MAGITDVVSLLRSGVNAINALNIIIGKVFPQSIGTSTTATGGAATLPANPVGFLNVVNPATGATVKIPYYNT